MPRLSIFNRPQILAHRMLVMSYPENTVLSLRETAKIGVDWVEFDVKQLTDGTMVSLHDSKVDRTTDGSGDITQMNFNEVKKLNAGNGYNFGFVPIPTCEDIIKELSEFKKKGQIIRAEMHIHNLWEPEPLIELLHKYNVQDLCYFNLSVIAMGEYIRDDLNDQKTLISFNVSANDNKWQKICNNLDVSYLCCVENLLNKNFIEEVHNYRLKNPVFLHCYPVHNEEKWQKMIDIGLDVIQTDYPMALKEYLAEKGFKT